MSGKSLEQRLMQLQEHKWSGSDSEIIEWAIRLADANERDDYDALAEAEEAITLSVEARRARDQG